MVPVARRARPESALGRTAVVITSATQSWRRVGRPFGPRRPRMTPDAWDRASDISQMIAFLGSEERGLARKRRLYLVALCRHFWQQLDAPTGRAAIDAAEAFADGRLSVDELRGAHATHLQGHLSYVIERGGKRSIRTRGGLLSGCALTAADPTVCQLVPTWHRSVARVAADLLRDIFGHRVRPPGESARWQTADVLGVARGIYEEKAFDRLPVLGDALMDAGCAAEAVLAHCQSAGPHVRGCWVVDWVLGKE